MNYVLFCSYSPSGLQVPSQPLCLPVEVWSSGLDLNLYFLVILMTHLPLIWSSLLSLSLNVFGFCSSRFLFLLCPNEMSSFFTRIWCFWFLYLLWNSLSLLVLDLFFFCFYCSSCTTNRSTLTLMVCPPWFEIPAHACSLWCLCLSRMLWTCLMRPHYDLVNAPHHFSHVKWKYSKFCNLFLYTFLKKA